MSGPGNGQRIHTAVAFGTTQLYGIWFYFFFKQLHNFVALVHTRSHLAAAAGGCLHLWACSIMRGPRHRVPHSRIDPICPQPQETRREDLIKLGQH